FSLTHGQVFSNGTNEGSPFDEGNVDFTALTGTATIDDELLSTPQADDLNVDNDAGALALTVKNSKLVMDASRAGTQNDSILVDAGTTGQMNMTVDHNTSSGKAGDAIQTSALGSASWNLAITNNDIESSVTPVGSNTDDLGGGLTISPGAYNGTFDYDIEN